MNDLRDAIAAIEAGDTNVSKSALVAALKAAEAEIAALRAAVSVIFRTNIVNGPLLDDALANYNAGNPNLESGVSSDVRRRVNEIAHSLSEPIKTAD